MGIYVYADLRDPQGDGHAYALHDDVVQGRIDELVGQDPQLSREDAQTMAEGEAMALARTQEGWPDDWADSGDYMQSFLTPPLAEDFDHERRWEDRMPSLPGNTGSEDDVAPQLVEGQSPPL